MRWRWLLLLPVALVAVLVASASRLHTMWWPNELHEQTSAAQGMPVEVIDDWLDDDGTERHRELTVTLVQVEPATEVETYAGLEALRAPEGTAVWEITLRFDVDPDVPLVGCYVSLVDTRGRESAAAGGTVAGVDLPRTGCAPVGRTGPLHDGTRLEGDKPRPPSYEVSVYAVTSSTVEPERVRLWWEAPDLVEFSVER